MSRRFQMDAVDVIKIAKGGGIAVVGTLLTYLTEQVPNVDLGQYTPLVTGFFCVLTNLFHKLVRKSEPERSPRIPRAARADED